VVAEVVVEVVVETEAVAEEVLELEVVAEVLVVQVEVAPPPPCYNDSRICKAVWADMSRLLLRVTPLAS